MNVIRLYLHKPKSHPHIIIMCADFVNEEEYCCLSKIYSQFLTIINRNALYNNRTQFLNVSYTILRVAYIRIHIWKCVSLRFINFIRITICVRAFHSMYYIPSESKLWYTQLISFDGRLNENCSCTCVLLYFQDTHTHTPNTLVPTVIIMEIIIIMIMLTMIMRCIESDKRSYTDTRYSLYAFGLFHFINNANTTKYIYTHREKIAHFSRGAIIFSSPI